MWVDALELKDLFHAHGVNFKLLPKVYDAVNNKNVRKYIQSVIAAKVVKDFVWQQLVEWRLEGSDTKLKVEEMVKSSIEGGSAANS